mmetsp:Transcript_37601/g.70119  ORF Transcript_37601/g.70119 Transcript_37601/m.70119 type:complete len:667 (+) Transcript_37601:41-2041(+)
MKCAAFAASLAVLALGVAAEEDGTLSPVGKVVQMLQAMSAKGKQELQDEKVQYARYAAWCKGTTAEKSKAIEETGSKIEVLSADMGKAATDAEVLGKEIEGHIATVAELEEQQSAATKVRDDEAKDYQAELKDYTESIDALAGAIETLDKEDYSRPQAEKAFAQFASKLGSSRGAQDVKKLAVAGAPKASGYDFQSGNITTMLKALKTKFSEEKVALEKAEMDKVHSHKMMMASLKDQADAESQDQTRKATLKNKKLALKASLEDEKTTATASKDADTKYLDDVTSTCRQKAADFESNQKIRSEELEAVAKAVKVVSEKLSLLDVKWRSLLQVKGKKGSSLAALRRGRGNDFIKAKIVPFLSREAQRLHSAALLNLVQPVAESSSLDGVKHMIEDRVTKLVDEVEHDGEQKTWCNSELKANKKTRSVKTVLVDELNADMDRLNASIISLGEDIVTLQAELVQLDKAMANATEIRGKEKEANAGTIDEAKKAQGAVTEAITVLKEFHDKNGLSPALLQVKKAEAKQPEIFEKTYGGMMTEASGVTGLLETISADYARLEADTAAEEQSSDEEFKKFASDYKVNKAEKEADVKHLTQTKVEHTAQLATKGTELTTAETELEAAETYFKQLEDSCVKGGAVWKEQEAMRKEELESLKEAMHLLENITQS